MINAPKINPYLPRVRALAIMLLFGLMAIVIRLWYLQIAHGEEQWQLSVVNERRLVRRIAPRGQITDMNGSVIAANRYELVVSAVPEEVKKDPDSLQLLSKLLHIPAADIQKIIDDNKVTSFDPVRVAEDVDIATATAIEEQHLNLPGIIVASEPIRFYPDGPLFGHVMGQMGEIQPDELKQRRNEGYRIGDYCGRNGLERAYDNVLKGIDGGREVQVDARGRMRCDLGNSEPIPGATVKLNIDKNVQRVAYDGLAALAAKGKPGAAVALDPNTGAVIALASVPAYDPNIWVKGLSHIDDQKIKADTRKPLIPRAFYYVGAPGSTFKLISAAAGLELGKASQYDSDYCGGYITLGKWKKHCHKLGGHGRVTLNSALAKSCDIYFYHLGQRLQPDNMAKYAREFGLGARTGIDLSREGESPADKSGTVPDDAYMEKRHMRWMGGEVVDYAIGQAMLNVTPLQMCNVAAAIANGGTLYKPQVVNTVTRYDERNQPYVTQTLTPKVLKHVNVSKHTLDIVRQGMVAVMQPGGTGASSAIPGITMAGKTGTAQMRQNGTMVNNAWFIGFAPVENPKIAVCVFVETGGHGGTVSAPIARRMIAAYLHMKIPEQRVEQVND